jgi:DNA-binding FrmR family transcriptional regulator
MALDGDTANQHQNRQVGTPSPDVPPEPSRRPVLWDEADVLRRLRRIEGQIRGVEAMVRRRDSCTAILTQLAAAEGALAQVHRWVAACGVAESLGELMPLRDTAAVRERLRRTLSKG